jgi:hypothetical protein
MTTKQGLLYNKKNEKYIENMQQRPDPMEHANQQANPFIYQKAAEKNVKFADEALTECKNMCDAKFSNDEREACYLGCDIKNNASSADDLSLFDKRSINNPYDKVRKEIKKTVDKTSDKKVSSAYKKWDPPHTYGWISRSACHIITLLIRVRAIGVGGDFELSVNGFLIEKKGIEK